MQAAVMYKPGDIRLEDVPKPAAKKGEGVLRVAAVGVCGSDIPRMLTKGAHRMPIVCGHEFSGEIVEAGEEVRGYDVGELVGVAPMLPCRVCDQCLTGNSRAAATTIISAAGATGLRRIRRRASRKSSQDAEGERSARHRHDRPGLDRAACGLEGPAHDG